MDSGWEIADLKVNVIKSHVASRRNCPEEGIGASRLFPLALPWQPAPAREFAIEIGDPLFERLARRGRCRGVSRGMSAVGPVIPGFKPAHMRAGLAVKLRAEYQHSGVEFAGRRSFLAAGLDRCFIDGGQQLSCCGRQVIHLPRLASAADGDDLRPERPMDISDLP